ncbi:hypothetical protein [Amycolatopsis alkalitolerans]|uniref:C2H2-type domain-containing protein n=1 Tax=Amycolatopsis alkalitolerans TaxID=2547244 RepID=A0A5C4M0K0_9PSEU|nr:hypothetical protein [Amycolatopsis alkalitolerans]TNC25838.1 hypothetical protein FG385_14455 [Amycolatopsis alkalitolerans]
MTVSDLHCDRCGRFVSSPADGRRFVYHPGRAQFRDTSGLLCVPCWDGLAGWLGAERPLRRCAVCGEEVTREQSLHVHTIEDPQAWRLCSPHAVEFLNSLRTVDPKLDAATFRFPGSD